MIPTLRSLPDPEALAAELGRRYGLGFTSCVLLRSLVNDVYEVATDDARYILKLYRYGGRGPDEIRWETGLSEHLRAAGVLAPPVLPLPSGDTVGVLETPEGPRPFTLLGYVEGSKPRPPFTDALYADFGRQLAAFHDAADNYTSPYYRPPADLVHRLERPLEEILAVDDAEENLLRSLAGAVRNNLAQYSKAGTCHGDVTLDNVLLTNQGLLLLDFDLAAVGPPAADFGGVATTPHWNAFKSAYAAHRPITSEDEAAIPYLQVAGSIFNLYFHLVDKPRWRGGESRDEGWAAAELDGLRAAADVLL
ncbi:phosphotransferase enzyme family protein [Kribbella sindirgiensis]|uniref:Aminoglycoside phosphotransferase n=1 Tax=Kribbella sindirgiensis TaxID=1124744 RepID=A0A4R0ITN3_9ACTN|nr:phosphotransferase [Kribbella sindirgiensis]TCC37231.1 aminoglycoside phosphotransferase [Kribbella sindirgiensis]